MWLFIGPTPLSGIGQVTKKYMGLVSDAEYCMFGDTPRHTFYTHGFAFILPVQEQLVHVDRCMTLCETKIYMTVCESEPVNPAYGILEKYKTLYCPSEFSRGIFAKQFPNTTWKLMRHWIPDHIPIHRESSRYIFYSIGNIMDPRKNIQSLVKAYFECNFGDKAALVLKATCMHHVSDIPGVIIINGLITDEQMRDIHNQCHCYINCSHSEGVGMGAVEAALMSKPVICSDYGGLKEYVQTPWIIRCTKAPIGYDDFLFTKDLEWGHPSYTDLVAHMKDCFTKNIRTHDHPETRACMDEVKNYWKLL